MKRIISVGSGLFGDASASRAFAGATRRTIKIGALNDMTGATSDVGKDYALGIAEAIHYVNDTGGINGKKIKLYQFDYGYRIPEALTKYNLFQDGSSAWPSWDGEPATPKPCHRP